MTTIKMKEDIIPSGRKDEEEIMITAEYKGKKYISHIGIDGMRGAVDRIRNLIDIAKKQFEKDIESNRIKPSDKVKFYFGRNGNFIIYPNHKSANIKLRVSKYAGDRLHIEIPAPYTHFFEQGEEVKVIKGNL